MQSTAIGTVAKSLPQNKVILLIRLISNSYILYTDLQKIVGIIVKSDNGNFANTDNAELPHKKRLPFSSLFQSYQPHYFTTFITSPLLKTNR